MCCLIPFAAIKPAIAPAILCLIILTSCHPTPKLAYVNPVKLAQESEAVQAAQRELAAVAAPLQANADTLAAELARATARYEQQRPRLSAAQAAARERALGQQQAQVAQYREATAQKLDGERTRRDAAVMADLNAFLKEYGRREGYTLILGATATGNIVYADEAADITPAVLRELNARYRRQHPAAR